MKKNVNAPDLKVLITPLALVLVMLVLAVVVYRVGITKIGARNKELADARKNEVVLAQRINTLREISAGVGAEAKAADAGLPSVNSGIIALAQLKKMAVEAELGVFDFGISAETKDGEISRVSVTIVLEGPGPTVVDYIGRLSSLAPILVPVKIRSNYTQNTARANINVSAFWAPWPAKLPALTEPVIELSAADKEVVAKVSALTQPEFLELAPQSPVTRENPF